MPKVNVHKPGSLCWIELATTDQPSAKKFYQQLFGWTSDDMPMGPGAFYTMFKLDGSDVAAAYTLGPDQLQRGVPTHWNLYVAVANVDESAKRAEELGASVLASPFDVFDAGRMAIIQDPTGAILSLWQAKAHSGVLVNNEEGALCWADLMTRDRDKASEFYSALLVGGSRKRTRIRHMATITSRMGRITSEGSRPRNIPIRTSPRTGTSTSRLLIAKRKRPKRSHWGQACTCRI